MRQIVQGLIVPSQRHELFSRLIPRIRGATTPLASPEAERRRLEQAHAAFDHALPARAVPAFRRRYEVTTSHLPFPVHVIRPRSHRPRATLYYLHGGGFVAPIDQLHVAYAVRLARVIDAEVVLPDYPLAPEHTWRDGFEPMRDDLAARLSIRDRVVVAGDSAGGGLALSLAQGVRDAGGRQPSELVLLSPWVDLTTSTPLTRELDDVDPWLSLAKLDLYARWWAGSSGDLGRYEVSPALGELDGLPPTLMFCGTRDLLMPGCRLLADRAAATDWPLDYREAPGLIHDFPLLPFLPEARTAGRITREFLS